MSIKQFLAGLFYDARPEIATLSNAVLSLNGECDRLSKELEAAKLKLVEQISETQDDLDVHKKLTANRLDDLKHEQPVAPLVRRAKTWREFADTASQRKSQ